KDDAVLDWKHCISLLDFCSQLFLAEDLTLSEQRDFKKHEKQSQRAFARASMHYHFMDSLCVTGCDDETRCVSAARLSTPSTTAAPTTLSISGELRTVVRTRATRSMNLHRSSTNPTERIASTPA